MLREDLILIFIFGNLSIVGLIGGPLIFYMSKKNAIIQKQESMMGIVAQGILIHIFSSGIYMIFMGIITSLYKLNITSLKPIEAAYAFFRIDWQHLSIDNDLLASETQKSLALILKTELTFFNMGIIIFVIGSFLFFVGQIYKNYKEQTSSSQGSGMDSVMELVSKKFMAIFIILIHLNILQATLSYLDNNNSDASLMKAIKLSGVQPMSLELMKRIPQSIGEK